MLLFVGTKDQDLWLKSEDEPALITAATLSISMHVQKHYPTWVYMYNQTKTRIFWFQLFISPRVQGIRSLLNVNKQALATMLLIEIYGT